MRYGAKLGERAHYRVYGKWFNRDSFESPSGADSNDDWTAIRGGFRVDWDISENSELTFQGDVYNGNSNTRRFTVTAPATSTIANESEDVKGANILTRWTRKLSDQSQLKVQFYYNKEEREGLQFSQDIDILDLDVQHRLALGRNHDLVWGFNNRVMIDELGNSFALSFNPGTDTNFFGNAFIQDQITLIPDRLKFTIGTKLGYNSFSGWEIQPNGRLLWTPNEHHSVWASASRAVRTPSRLEDSFTLNFMTAGPNTLQVTGNTELKSENLLAYELGYRLKATKRLFLNIATFYNVYNDLLTSEPVAPSAPFFITTQNQNLMKGEAWGVEVASTWDVFDFWRIKAAFTWFELDLFLDPASQSLTSTTANGASPQFQMNFRSYMNLPNGWELDAAFNYVDELPDLGIKEYVRLDLRLGWHVSDHVELSVTGQNLLERNHQEFLGFAGGIQPALVPLSVYGKVTLRF